MNEIHVAVRSYKRAGRVTTLNVVPFAHIWVPESQGDDYRRYYGADRVITIPDNEDGNLSRKNNAILRRSPSKWTLVLDDDITRIGYFEDNKSFWMNPEEIAGLIEHGFTLASDLGVEMWGVNQNKDPLTHYTYRPLSLISPILGPFVGHLHPSIWYDESVLGKDDYDYWLQNIQKLHKTLRLNKYHYDHNQATLPGGFVSQRSLQAEQQGVMRMRQKWGDKIFTPGGAAGGKSARGENILNSMIRLPIPGV